MDKHMRKYRFHWTLHPEKDLDWYEGEKNRMSPDSIARDLDINYSLSVSGKVFSTFNEVKHSTSKNLYNPQLPVYRIWDFGKTSCVLWAQIDRHNRKRLLHECVLENTDTFEQVHVTLAESHKYFPDAYFEDICDPAGAWSKDGLPTSTVDILNEAGIYPQFERILHIPMKDRKRQGRDLIHKDLQTAPGGEEALLIHVSERMNAAGCPILKAALLGAYCYKKDYTGNITDKIAEMHPFEDVIDCLLYLYLETHSGGFGRVQEKDYRPQSNGYGSDYTHYFGF
jgi:hypothetical protein